MIEADAGLTALAFQQGDDKTFAQFYMRPTQDKAATLEAGRPIYVDKPYVRIMVPGDKDNIVDRPMRMQDKRRWPRQWQAFEIGMEQVASGTPLSEWAGIARSQVEELRHFNIRTVEDLCNVPDSIAQKFMGINKLKGKAKDYVAEAEKQAPYDKLREENAMLLNEIAALKDQFKQMVDKPKRRGKTEE